MTTIAAFYLVMMAWGGGRALIAIPMATLSHCEAAADQVRKRLDWAACVPTGFQP